MLFVALQLAALSACTESRPLNAAAGIKRQALPPGCGARPCVLLIDDDRGETLQAGWDAMLTAVGVAHVNSAAITSSISCNTVNDTGGSFGTLQGAGWDLVVLEEGSQATANLSAGNVTEILNYLDDPSGGRMIYGGSHVTWGEPFANAAGGLLESHFGMMNAQYGGNPYMPTAPLTGAAKPGDEICPTAISIVSKPVACAGWQAMFSTWDAVGPGAVRCYATSGALKSAHVRFQGPTYRTQMWGLDATNLSVADRNGLMLRSITWAFRPTAASAGSSVACTAGVPCALSASGTDLTGLPLTFVWDLNNNGVFGEPGEPSGAAPSPIFTTVGTFTIGVRVANTYSSLSPTTTVTVSPGAPAQLAFAAQPTSTTAGTAISPLIKVAVQDSSGNVVTTSTANITIAIGANPGGASLSGTTTVAAVSGIASFSNLSLDKAASSYTLTAASGVLTAAGSVAFDITPAAASKLAFTVGPSTTTAGAAFAPTVQVAVLDGFDNLVPSSTASVTMAIGVNPTGGALSGTLTVAAVGGVAAFSNLSIDKTGVGYGLTATSGVLASASSAGFNINPGAASKLVFSVQPTSATAGVAIGPAIQVLIQDSLGNTVTSSSAIVSIAIGANPGGGTLSGTANISASSGVATFPSLSINKAGAGYTLAATAGPLTGATSAAFNIGAAGAAQLAFAVQPTNAAAGIAIAPALQVTVQDTFGNTVAGSTASITIAIGTNPGGGTLSGTLTVAAVAGTATFSNLSIDKAGNGYKLTGSSGALTVAGSVPFNIFAAAASKLAFTVQPVTATAGTSVNPAVQVTVQDAFGNPVAVGSFTVAVAIGTNPSAGTLSGTLTQAAVSGVATFANLSIDKAGAGYMLTAASGALASATSAAFNINPGPATQLAFLVQPTSSTAGVALTPPVKVAVQDVFGNTVTGSALNVTLAIGTNPSAGILSGTASVAAVAGVATFSNLSIDKTGVGYTLLASGLAVTQVVSSAFNIDAAGATKLAFVAQPSSSIAGAAISPSFRVAVQDAIGNTVTTSTASITVTLGSNPSGGTLAGTLTVAAVAGVANFSNVSVDKAGTPYTLVASSGVLTASTSGQFAVTAAAASKLAFVAQPPNATAGAPWPTVKVAVQDAFGNVVTTSTSAVTLAIANNPGTGTLTGTLSVAAVAGVASFSPLSIDKAGAGYTLGASGTFAPGTSAAFSIVAGPAVAVVFGNQPGSSVAGLAISPAVTVKIVDNFNNVTPSTTSVTLTLGNNPGAGTLSGTLSVAAVGGVATFTNLSINRTAVGYTLLAGAPGLAGAASAAFNIIPGAAVGLAFAVQPTSAAAGSAIAPSVRVTVLDADANTVTSSTATIVISISTNPGGGALFGTLSVAAVAGVAIFPGLSIDKTGSGYKLSAASGGLASATSVGFDVLPAAATLLAFSVQPTNTAAGTPVTPAIKIAVRDALGNVITSSSASITLTLGANPGAGALAGTLTVSAVAGVATFSAVSIDKAAAGYTLVAISAGLASATSAPFNITAAAAAKLAFAVQPATSAAGAPLSPAVSVSVKDAFDNVVTGSTANITLALGANPGAAMLSGTLTVAAVSGVAGFSSLRLDKVGVGYTLVASSGLLTSATSGSFDITAAAASKLAFVTQPTSAIAGAAIGPTIKVAAQDAFGNLVPGSMGNVTLTLGTNPSFGTMSGAATGALTGGAASFANVSIDKSGGGYTLVASSSGLTSATSAPFDINTGAPSKLAFTAQPVSGPAGITFVSSVAVAVEDALGNIVTNATPTLTLAIGANPGSGTLSGMLTVAAVGGVASFPNLSIDKTGAGYTLTATSAGLEAATSAAFTIDSGMATQLVFAVAPGASVVGKIIAPTVRVWVEDALGNRDTTSGANVTLALGANPGSGTLAGTLTVAAVSGIASFANLSIDQIGSGYTLIASAAGLTPAKSAPFDVATGLPPVIIHDAIASAGVGIAYPYNAFGAIASGGTPPITFAVCGGPMGFKVDGLTGAVGWTATSTGAVSLCVKATNAFGTDSYTFNVDVTTPTGLGPVAAFTVTPSVAPASASRAFDGTESAGALVVWRWDYGDFSPVAVGSTSVWDYRLAGSYQSELTVIDGFGRVAWAKRPVTVLGSAGQKPPVAKIIASKLSGTEPIEFSCDCQLGDKPIAGHRWDFGDTVGFGPTLTRTFSPGRYRVHLSVVDEAGLTASDWVEISVAGPTGQQPPQCRASLAPSSGKAPLQVSHTVSASDPDGQLVALDLGFFDGTHAKNQLEAPLGYAAPGRYPVKLTVTDDQMLTCRDTVEVIAVGADGVIAPSFFSSPPAEASCGKPYAYRPVAAGTAPYTWALSAVQGESLPKGLTIDEGTGAIQFTPAASGAQKVRLTATNAAGSAEQLVELEVTCPVPANYGVGCACGSGQGAAVPWAFALFALAWAAARKRVTARARR